MFKKFITWTRIYLLIGVLASTLIGMPVQAGGTQSSPIRDAKSLVAPPRPVLLSPAIGVIVKNMPTPILRWKDSGAHYYRIQIAYNKTFLNLVKDDILTREEITAGIKYAPTLPPGKRLFWRVQAYNAADQASLWSPKWYFFTPLQRPTLVSPSNAEVLVVDRPTFTWNVATNSKQYILQVSALQNFSTLLLNKAVTAPELGSIVEFRMTTDLPQNKTLYWRVRGKNSILTGPWSEKWSFKTGNPPSVPVLVSPVNAALVRDYTPLFNWNNSKVPTGVTFKQYELQVDNDADFSSPEVEATNTVSDFTPLDELTSETKYFWRVRAVGTISDVDHISGWSTRWSFITAIPAPTSLTVNPNANPLRPTFDWDDGTGTNVTGYSIQISVKSDFSTFLVNGTTQNSRYIPGSNLPAGKLLYWRVRVNGTNGPSAWTDVAEYTTPTP